MSGAFRIALLTGTLVYALGSVAITSADEPTGKVSDSSQTDSQNAKKKVLAWIDDYRKNQVLFHDEDLVRLRKELQDDTPEQALEWWSKTEPVRAALESPQWHETREWLREFLRVQAIYSDEQIEEFRAELKEAAGEESPRKFEDMLTDIEQKRSNLVRGSADNKALRERQMAVLDAFRKEQAAERVASARAAAQRPPTNPVPAAPVRTRDARYSQPPLVDSLDFARWNVMRNFWRW